MNHHTAFHAICTVLGALVGAILAILANQLWGVLGIVGLLTVMIALYLGIYLTGGER